VKFKSNHCIVTFVAVSTAFVRSYVVYEIFCRNDENFSDEKTIKKGCLLLYALADVAFHKKYVP
jgi:hypothetical protein